MLDPHGLYEFTGDRPELDRPVLVVALTGFVDAGGAVRLVQEQLRGGPDARPIATFDVDQLLDYRSRRPGMDFVEDHWEHYDHPRLGIDLLHDLDDTPYLVLSGIEPDLQWERFVAAVTGLVERFGVRLCVGMNAIPMGVPHTRPTGITAHASRRELIAGYEPWLQRVRVPASAGHLLEYRLGQQGHDALGFAVHVPHYLAQTEYPAAAELLITSICRSTGLRLPTERLHAAAQLVRGDIDRQIAASDEAGTLVRALEEQYDAYQRGQRGRGLLASDAGPLPTAEELGAELERFLAEQANPGDQPESAGS